MTVPVKVRPANSSTVTVAGNPVVSTPDAQRLDAALADPANQIYFDATLTGQRSIGVSAPVELTRDDHGYLTVTAANRLDAARALGFAHAQDRFFQMDLLRRSAAGDLQRSAAGEGEAHPG